MSSPSVYPSVGTIAQKLVNRFGLNFVREPLCSRTICLLILSSVGMLSIRVKGQGQIFQSIHSSVHFKSTIKCSGQLDYKLWVHLAQRALLASQVGLKGRKIKHRSCDMSFKSVFHFFKIMIMIILLHTPHSLSYVGNIAFTAGLSYIHFSKLSLF